jgi:hypothetical protein
MSGLLKKKEGDEKDNRNALSAKAVADKFEGFRYVVVDSAG